MDAIAQASAVPELRFEFGRNWQRFLTVLDEERISDAERSLKTMLGLDTLAGKKMLDVGCGSGLFSLAATRLGAARVHSFDYDPQSVACANQLRQRFAPPGTDWTIERGSALDSSYLEKLGQWDIVYSWGVLHHTGDMHQALTNVVGLVRNDGILFISIYNDQGWKSRAWRHVKRLYNRGPVARGAILATFACYAVSRGAIEDIARGRNPMARYRAHKRRRGMSVIHDWFDWLGGYPYEVARPQEIVDLYGSFGFELERVQTTSSLGCNEFVLRRH
jgi:SAM-dependent methyltransferase